MFVELDCLTDKGRKTKVIVNTDAVENVHTVSVGGETYTRIVMKSSVVDVTLSYHEVKQVLFAQNRKRCTHEY